MAELTPLDEKLGEVLGLAQAAQAATKQVGGEEEALDGFEFLSMSEAGELCHWEIVQKMSETLGDQQVNQLAGWAVPIQREHVETVRGASLALATEEAKEMASA